MPATAQVHVSACSYGPCGDCTAPDSSKSGLAAGRRRQGRVRGVVGREPRPLPGPGRRVSLPRHTYRTLLASTGFKSAVFRRQRTQGPLCYTRGRWIAPAPDTCACRRRRKHTCPRNVRMSVAVHDRYRPRTPSLRTGVTKSRSHREGWAHSGLAQYLWTMSTKHAVAVRYEGRERSCRTAM